jgi:alpha-ketoglutarate-dependent taurine dioxygenase
MTRSLIETKQLLGRFADPEEGKALLERLRAHFKQPHLIYTHVWR